MTILSSVKTGGDVLIHHESLLANLKSVKVKTASAGTNNVPQIAGYPVVVAAGVATLLKTTEMATATHLLVSGPPIKSAAAATTLTGKWLAVGIENAGAGGNIVVNEDSLPTHSQTVDAIGTAWAGADADHIALKAALDGLGFRFLTEPVETEIQTT